MAVTLTKSAIDRVVELSDKAEIPSRCLRVGVRGGGCSGLSYFLDFVEAPTDADKTYNLDDDVILCVDKKSYLFLNGTEIDFERSLMKAGFVFHNPLASRSCSCGESFAP